MGWTLRSATGGAARIAVIAVVVLLVAGATALAVWAPQGRDLANTPLISAAFGSGIGEPLIEIPGSDAKNGPAAMQRYGCISCHTVPGVSGAHGTVGPPLNNFGHRVYVAGVLPNTPDNLMHWIQNPQEVVPGNGMPDLGVSEQDARDIASYLYTLDD